MVRNHLISSPGIHHPGYIPADSGNRHKHTSVYAEPGYVNRKQAYVDREQSRVDREQGYVDR